MEPVRLWAAVEFTAQSGSTDALLGHAAQAGLHLTRIVPLPGGFRARCAAWHYRPLAALARQGHVRLRVEKRLWLFFRLRPLLRRTGLWAGLALFIPLLLWSQQFVWAVDTSTLTRGQAARAFAVLRQADLAPGAAATEAKRTAGEYALLESGEFSWASLNFAKGRLEVRAAAAVPKPAIAAGTLHGLRARCAGVVTKTNLTSGTMLVVPGQAVEAGQGLIGTARQERDGALIFAPAAGTVRAQLEWSDAQSVPLEETVLQPPGRYTVRYRLSAAGQNWTLPSVQPPEQALERTRHLQPELLGLPLPCSVEETTFYEQQPQLLRRTEAQALALARLHSLQTLYTAFPDAVLIARKEDTSCTDTTLEYTAVYTLEADICTQNDRGRCMFLIRIRRWCSVPLLLRHAGRPVRRIQRSGRSGRTDTGCGRSGTPLRSAGPRPASSPVPGGPGSAAYPWCVPRCSRTGSPPCAHPAPAGQNRPWPAPSCPWGSCRRAASR